MSEIWSLGQIPTLNFIFWYRQSQIYIFLTKIKQQKFLSNQLPLKSLVDQCVSEQELNLHCINFASDDSVLYINNSNSPQNQGASASTNSPKYNHYATIDHSRRHGSKNSSKINNSNTISGSATTGRPTKGLMHSASCPFKVNSSSFSEGSFKNCVDHKQ